MKIIALFAALAATFAVAVPAPAGDMDLEKRAPPLVIFPPGVNKKLTPLVAVVACNQKNFVGECVSIQANKGQCSEWIFLQGVVYLKRTSGGHDADDEVKKFLAPLAPMRNSSNL